MKSILKLTIAGLFAAAGAVHADVTPIGQAVSFQGHLYTLLSADTWTNSEAFAQTLGGHLVAVNSAAENAFISNTFGANNALWIGLARTGPDSFGWVNGDALTYTNWAGGEPNNYGGNENYVHTYVGGQWNDLPNDSGYAGPKYGVVEVTPVPEPSQYAMMIAGLGLMGAFVRRRKAK